MSGRRVVWLLARREVTERARSKAFVGSSLLTLAIVLVVAVLPGVLESDGPATYDVGYVPGGGRAEAVAEALPAVAAAVEDVEVEVREIRPGEAEGLLAEGDLDAVLAGDEVLVHEELDGRLEVLLAGAAAAGDAAAARQLELRVLDPPDPEAEDREAMVGVGTFLLYGQLIGFGVWVASGLVEEKAGRVAELLLTKATPSQILAGKVLGIGLVGFVQLVATVAAGLVAAVAAGTVDLPPGTPGAVAMVLGWFVLGFAFFSCLFAVGGALASRAEEMQATTAPVTVVAILAFLAAAAAGGDPGGTLARVATFVPPSAPLVLPIRHAAGELAWWEVIVAVAVVGAATVLVVRLAARAYAGAALHVKGTMKLRDALRAT